MPWKYNELEDRMELVAPRPINSNWLPLADYPGCYMSPDGMDFRTRYPNNYRRKEKRGQWRDLKEFRNQSGVKMVRLPVYNMRDGTCKTHVARSIRTLRQHAFSQYHEAHWQDFEMFRASTEIPAAVMALLEQLTSLTDFLAKLNNDAVRPHLNSLSEWRVLLAVFTEREIPEELRVPGMAPDEILERWRQSEIWIPDADKMGS